MAWLYASGRKAAAVVVTVTMVAAAVPCVIFLVLRASGRNTLAVVNALRELPRAPLYTDFYSARGLRILAPDLGDIEDWYMPTLRAAR